MAINAVSEGTSLEQYVTAVRSISSGRGSPNHHMKRHVLWAPMGALSGVRS